MNTNYNHIYWGTCNKVWACFHAVCPLSGVWLEPPLPQPPPTPLIFSSLGMRKLKTRVDVIYSFNFFLLTSHWVRYELGCLWLGTSIKTFKSCSSSTTACIHIFSSSTPHMILLDWIAICLSYSDSALIVFFSNFVPLLATFPPRCILIFVQMFHV